MENRKTAIIIGAGPAGLTAAHELLKNTEILPIIFEESDEIGGISKTVRHGNCRIDIGGHRFFSKNQDVMNFWTDILPIQGADSKDDIILARKKELSEGGPDPEKEDRVMLLRNRVSRILYLRKFFAYPISITPSTILNLGFFRTLKAGFGYIISAIFKRKGESLEDFMINRFGKPLYGMFFEDYNKKVWGVSPAEMSADWGAQRIKGLSLRKAVASFFAGIFSSKKKKREVETSLIEEFYYPKKGPGQLWEAVAADVEEMGGKLLKNSPVVGIKTEKGKISGVEVRRDGKSETYKADYYISTMPIKDLIEAIDKREEIPENVYNTAVNLPYRDFMTVGLLVDRLSIKNKTGIPTVADIVPDCWIYIQERDVKIGRLQIFNNWSPYMLEDIENTVWVGLEYFCNEGDEMWQMDDDDFIKFAVDELVKIKIIDSAENVKDSVRIRVKKAYPGYFGVYKDFPAVREYLEGFENLFCIGRNGQHRYNNMDHSMLTAMECVRIIGSGGTDKSPIWNVNTEQEYHEEKTEEA